MEIPVKTISARLFKDLQKQTTIAWKLPLHTTKKKMKYNHGFIVYKTIDIIRETTMECLVHIKFTSVNKLESHIITSQMKSWTYQFLSNCPTMQGHSCKTTADSCLFNKHSHLKEAKRSQIKDDKSIWSMGCQLLGVTWGFLEIIAHL